MVIAFKDLAHYNENAFACSASIRKQNSYFLVDEVLPFQPEGTGGHVWLKIRKQNTNTEWLSRALAKLAQVPLVDIGYAGLKDRYAVTTQWFSIKTEGIIEPDWSDIENDDIKIIEQTRHTKKLKRGVLSGNQFTLRLTDLAGAKGDWQHNLEQIKSHGVPNYFAEQRFGHNGNNLLAVQRWFTEGKAPKKRQQKSLYLSAARSWLFNLVLDQRVQQQNWDKVVAGDMMLLAGTKASLFAAEHETSELQQRLASMDIHPTGPLWGRGKVMTQGASQILEQNVLADWQVWQMGLEKAGLKQDRRALRVYPESLSWQFLSSEQLELTFFLPAGCYATAVMRELAIIENSSHATRAASTIDKV